MFRGTSTHNLDAKGRLSIPARFREALKSSSDSRLVVTNLPYCLVAYPMEEWRAIEEHFSKFRFGPPKVLQFKRYLLGAAVDCNLDGQGRILIPAHLRDKAGLNKNVVLIGMGNYFEIWNPDAYHEQDKATSENFEQLNDELSRELGVEFGYF